MKRDYQPDDQAAWKQMAVEQHMRNEGVRAGLKRWKSRYVRHNFETQRLMAINAQQQPVYLESEHYTPVEVGGVLIDTGGMA